MDHISLITGIFVGAAAGYIGSFMVLRRMALVGDALSHVALPGVALAYVYSFNPFLGAFAALLIGIIIIWFIESKTTLPTESLVGLMFTFALAVGLLITPEEEIFHALIGDIANVTVTDMLLAVVLSMAIILVMQIIYRRFVLTTVSLDLAQSSNVNVKKINLIFLFLVAVIVALGIKVVGTLLMGALVIIPAITARNMTASLSTYARLSTLMGLMSMLTGIVVATYLNLPAGPIVVLVSSLIFVISFALKK